MSTGVGLLLFGLDSHLRQEEIHSKVRTLGDITARMKAWFTGNF
jgi:hypothetical protein